MINDYKSKLRKSEQEVSSLVSYVARLEAQIESYRRSAYEAEKLEDELKADKRKLQRDVCMM